MFSFVKFTRIFLSGSHCWRSLCTNTCSGSVPAEKLTIIPTVMVHGGCSENTPDKLLWVLKNNVKAAARFGHEELSSTGDVLNAVKVAVSRMEADPVFNAGYGSSLTWEGTIEMDAAIMRGSDLKAGCVSLVHDIASPVKLALAVMKNTNHTYMAGENLMKLAWDNRFECLKNDALMTARAKDDLKQLKEKVKAQTEAEKPPTDVPQEQPKVEPSGTVGAVAIDEYGNVAAATSTGGITGKLPGRIGDSGILGASTYADNEIGALSTTGHGESIMRFNVGSRILAYMEYTKCTPQEAAQKILSEMLKRLQSTAGVIVIDKCGQLGISFTAQHMPWAYKRGRELHSGIVQGEDEMEMLSN